MLTIKQRVAVVATAATIAAGATTGVAVYAATADAPHAATVTTPAAPTSTSAEHHRGFARAYARIVWVATYCVHPTPEHVATCKRVEREVGTPTAASAHK